MTIYEKFISYFFKFYKLIVMHITTIIHNIIMLHYVCTIFFNFIDLIFFHFIIDVCRLFFDVTRPRIVN